MDDLSLALKEIQHLEDVRLFCHFTDVDGEVILNEGLKLYQKEWYTTLLEVTEEEREDLESFIIDQTNEASRLRLQSTCVIAAVPMEIGYNFVTINRNANLNIGDMPYIIPSGYLLCAVDLENRRVNYNEEALALENSFLDTGRCN